MARIFVDCEFIEDGRTIELLSIGAISEDGQEFYAEIAETNRALANPWVAENVLPMLKGPMLPRREVAQALVEFAGPEPKFWAYFSAYDWVALCQLYGTMMDLPKGWPMWCRDLKQLAVDRGDPDLQELVPHPGEHHALNDAMWSRYVWFALQGMEVPHT